MPVPGGRGFGRLSRHVIAFVYLARSLAVNLVAVVLLAACFVGIASSQAAADRAPGLCEMNESRGAIPRRFAVDTCVDGGSIWLRDQLKVPVRFTVDGDVGSPRRIRIDFGIAAIVTRTAYPDPLLMLPSDIVRLPIGSKAASATLADTHAGGFYSLAVALAIFVPAAEAKDIYEAFASLVRTTFDAYGRYRDCLVGKNWIGQLGCRATLRTTIVTAVALNSVKAFLAVVRAGPARIIKLLLETLTYLDFLNAQRESINKIIGSERTITQAATQNQSSGQPSTTRPPPPPPPPPPTVNPTPYGPDTCGQGYVWREAFDTDHVCVTPAIRSQVADDNAHAASRWTVGPYGPDTCLMGFVWREASPTDHVCVVSGRRSQAGDDNANATDRLAVAPRRCKTGYVWRQAFPTDYVCVLAATRDGARYDNSQANNRRNPTGPYGVTTCVQGYVWRGARPVDHVCVTPETRSLTAADNAAAASRTA